ncbi:Chaperonin complex component, TCP-1 delta subunit (CCT4) [Pseudoloma neurophilia]|uniref:Chaperonin complex component, TCP-1 delta subunit (CCT4) n=1 Tax=Pseudoloma neurophilia TaxID=146866 RepID=A0A0R0M094_9MICR|nr:Chaperonin complex component, TCP-1 delta subunit (CCT4) [Pseudoloma neurophilia]
MQKEGPRVTEITRSFLHALSSIKSTLSTSFGPFGHDKMIINKSRVLTNDGATIIKEILNDTATLHPLFKILTSLTAYQDTLTGDGTTSILLLTISFYETAVKLIESGCQRTKIIRTLEEMAKEVKDILKEIRIEIDNASEVKDASSGVKDASSGSDLKPGVKETTSGAKETTDGKNLLIQAVTTSLNSKVLSNYFSEDSPFLSFVINWFKTNNDKNYIHFYERVSMDDISVVDGLIFKSPSLVNNCTADHFYSNEFTHKMKQKKDPASQEKLSENQEKPSVNQEKPSENQEKPSVNQEKPSENQETLSVVQESPSVSQEKPSENQVAPSDSLKKSNSVETPSENSEGTAVALLMFPLSSPKPNIDSRILIKEGLNDVIEEEKKYIVSLIKSVILEMNVLNCKNKLLIIKKSILRESVSDLANYFLGKLNINYIILEGEKIEKISEQLNVEKSVEGRIMAKVMDVRIFDQMVRISEIKSQHSNVSNENYNIESCEKVNPLPQFSDENITYPNKNTALRPITVLVNACDETICKEYTRSLNDALMTCQLLVKYPFVLPGGGAAERYITLRKYDNFIKKQLYSAMECVPFYLCKNAGLNYYNLKSDTTESVDELKTSDLRTSDLKGVDLKTGTLTNLLTHGVIIPETMVSSYMTMSMETAAFILSIDDVLPGKHTG